MGLFPIRSGLFAPFLQRCLPPSSVNGRLNRLANSFPLNGTASQTVLEPRLKETCFPFSVCKCVPRCPRLANPCDDSASMLNPCVTLPEVGVPVRISSLRFFRFRVMRVRLTPHTHVSHWFAPGHAPRSLFARDVPLPACRTSHDRAGSSSFDPTTLMGFLVTLRSIPSPAGPDV